MNCPTANEWDLLAIEALKGERAESMLTHVRTCDACRERFESARRAHVDRVRMYEAFDRDHDALREQMMAALSDELPRRSHADRLVRGCYRLGDYVMSLNTTTGRRALAVLAPAACILIVAGMFFWPGQRNAFAAAIEHLKRAETIVCRVTAPEGLKLHGMKFEVEGKMYIADQYGSYSEMSMNGQVITRHFSLPEGPMIVIQPPTQSYMELDVSEIGFLEMNEQSPDAWIHALLELTEDAATELETEVVDGVEEVGYRIAGEKLGFPTSRDPEAEEAYAEIWVDTESELPTRLLISMPIPVQETTLRLLYDQFEYDVPLEAALFEPDIPEDYIKLDVKLARPTEEALMNALARIGEFTGGRYPTSLDPVSVFAELQPMINDEGRKKIHEIGQKGILELGMQIAGGAMYHMKLVREGREPEYFGETVTADDAGEVLVRWTLEDGSTRVIYGDLRVETLPASE